MLEFIKSKTVPIDSLGLLAHTLLYHHSRFILFPNEATLRLMSNHESHTTLSIGTLFQLHNSSDRSFIGTVDGKHDIACLIDMIYANSDSKDVLAPLFLDTVAKCILYCCECRLPVYMLEVLMYSQLPVGREDIFYSILLEYAGSWTVKGKVFHPVPGGVNFAALEDNQYEC